MSESWPPQQMCRRDLLAITVIPCRHLVIRDRIAMYNTKLHGVQFPEGGAQLTSNTTWTVR